MPGGIAAAIEPRLKPSSSRKMCLSGICRDSGHDGPIGDIPEQGGSGVQELPDSPAIAFRYRIVVQVRRAGRRGHATSRRNFSPEKGSPP